MLRNVDNDPHLFDGIITPSVIERYGAACNDDKAIDNPLTSVRKDPKDATCSLQGNRITRDSNFTTVSEKRDFEREIMITTLCRHFSISHRHDSSRSCQLRSISRDDKLEKPQLLRLRSPRLIERADQERFSSAFIERRSCR